MFRGENFLEINIIVRIILRELIYSPGSFNSFWDTVVLCGQVASNSHKCANERSKREVECICEYIYERL